MSYELEHCKLIEGKLLPRDFRGFTRDILANVAAGGSGNAIDIIRATILDAQSDIQQSELNHVNIQQSLLRRVSIIESALTSEQLKALRSGQASREDRLALINIMTLDICLTFLENHGLSKNEAHMPLKQKPVILRYFYASVRYCVDWIARGGVLSIASNRITNDIFDQNYVLVASFFNCLLSKEIRVQEADAALRGFMRNV